MRKLTTILLALLFIQCTHTPAPEKLGPTPAPRQLAWQEMEFYAFIHFSMNTFTDDEWGYGDKSPKLFNPTDLDCRQWARVCKEAGMKGIILTAKHHDGFCLWPTNTTDYSIKQSPWRDGQGDLVKELREACDEYGLKLGIYLSPWDRNNKAYGTPEYINIFRDQLRELLTQYGDVFEVWFDGANGGDGYYGGAREKRKIDRKTYYDWENTYKIVRELQPNACLFSDAGPDVRWVGTEEGFANKTNWSTLRRDEVWPGWPHYVQLRSGHEDGNYWVPAEVNTSIRPGWFYHKKEDNKVKTLPHLMDIYYHSIGRNGTFLLNLPLDRRGQIHPTDVKQLVALGKQIKADFHDEVSKSAKTITASNVRGNSETFGTQTLLDNDLNTYWATDDTISSALITMTFDQPVTFNRVLLQENIQLGQRVQKFSVEIWKDNRWKEIAQETTIGYKRILRTPNMNTTKVRIMIEKSKGAITLSKAALYLAPALLVEPRMFRTKDGMVYIIAPDQESEIYYTVNSSNPIKNEKRYTVPFKLDHKAMVSARIKDPKSGKYSPITSKLFDIPATQWIVNDNNVSHFERIVNGQDHNYGMIEDNKQGMVIDLGQVYHVSGFRYLPIQDRWSLNFINKYEFYVSLNGKSWGKPVLKGSFDNIRNHPIIQSRVGADKKGRYIKFVPIETIDHMNKATIARFDVLTK
ncbi:alpha-L-fucosidase [Halosquirtibacter xylanolyticus]|uniref:alpha-L-fucosidase n=1 Tax=Halosquirtibacter xylanolyticus TaxID=3374599 RepID=UPI003747C602|nr:alpha-L-fucosidase [Prolixibacteraceae bacterium]